MTRPATSRVTSKVQTGTANPANKTFTVGYSYANGRQTSITYPSGHAVSYAFDSQGHIASMTVDGVSILVSATYFPFGMVKGWTWGNGEPYSRSYDLDGRVSTITIGPAASVYADLSEVFSYDGLNRFVTANLAAGQSQSFTYDANGNRTNATINAASTNYNYPSNSHRLSSLSGATTRSFTYDNAGNVTSSAGITYAYDGRGRMKQAGTTTYAINGLGRRVKKNNGTDIFFAYDEAGHLIGEYDTTGAPIEETVWLGDLPVAVIRPSGASFDLFYVWADNLGTPREITDTANQERWEWPSADPFGNNLPNENPAGLGAFTYNLRFPGQYYDAEKGSNYNYFRDYDPAIGRYAESDPIGLRGGFNTYAYVGSKTLRWADPSGLQVPWWVGMGGGGGGEGATIIGASQSSSSSGSRNASIARGLTHLINQCIPDDPCDNLRRQMEDHMDLMERKYLDLFNDPNDLYNLAFDSNPGGTIANYGTWLGHVSRYKGLRDGLKNLIDEALRLGCPIPIRAYTLLVSSPPIKPHFK